MLNIQQKKNGVTIECYVTPRSSRNQIKGVREGAVSISLHSPPFDGKANEALIGFIADTLSVPKSNVSILKGETGRRKILFVQGMSKDQVTSHFKSYINL